MYKAFFLIFLAILISSCSPTPVTEREMKEAMKKANFDQQSINNLEKYISLKAFLEKNIDTIISYRYHKNIVTYAGEKGKIDSTYLSDDDCYNFFQGNDQYDITNVPKHLKKELDSLFHTFTEKETPSFAVCKDKKITIEFKHERFENNLALLHSFIWDTKTSNKLEYCKDTILLDKCIYRIRLTELGR